MFDSLADKIREDDHKEVNQTERIVRWVAVAVLSICGIRRSLYGHPHA